MNYIPLSDDYKSSSIYHHRYGSGNLLLVCSSIINSLTSENENELKTWATSSRHNILHLIRFLRWTSDNQINLASRLTLGIGCRELDTSVCEDMLRDDDGVGYIFLNGVKITIKNSDSKGRDKFLYSIPIKFESFDFSGKEIWAYRVFMSLNVGHKSDKFYGMYGSIDSFLAFGIIEDEEHFIDYDLCEARIKEIYEKLSIEFEEFKKLNKQYL